MSLDTLMNGAEWGLILGASLALLFVIRYAWPPTWRMTAEGRLIMALTFLIGVWLASTVVFRHTPATDRRIIYVVQLVLEVALIALMVWLHVLLTVAERTTPPDLPEVLMVPAPVPPSKPGLFARLAAAARYLAHAEPARVQATAKGLLGLAVLVGIAIPTDLDWRVGTFIAGAYGLVQLWQGEATRARVVPVGKVPEGTVLTDGQVIAPPAP